MQIYCSCAQTSSSLVQILTLNDFFEMKLIVLYFFLDIIHLASLSGNSSVFHNCTFSPWTSYDSCSATCGGGFKTRRKFILNDENRDTCWKLANKTQIIPCAVLPCPIGTAKFLWHAF